MEKILENHSIVKLSKNFSIIINHKSFLRKKRRPEIVFKKF